MTLRPGPHNDLCDVEGLRVGNAEDAAVRTGVTVILPDRPAVMAVDVRGAAPGTRETDALRPGGVVEGFHALVLSGGSTFGLAAADGVTNWLSEKGIGLDIGPRAIPVVPAAILYDLNNGGDKDWGAAPPYRDLAAAACEGAGRSIALGNSGAGYGATAGRMKGGLGSASIIDDDGIVVAALLAVNSFGEAVMPDSDAFWAWPFEQGGEFGGRRPGGEAIPLSADEPADTPLAQNTTIGVIATNARLDKSQARQVARMAHDGLARAIRPVHTPFDGDTLFCLATGAQEMAGPGARQVAVLGHRAADCAARAVARGVYEARRLGKAAAYRDRFGP